MEEIRRKEKRQSQRLPVKGGSASFRICYLFIKGGTTVADLLDLSKGGARIRSTKKLKPGQKLDVRISPGGGIGEVKVQAEVEWCQTGNQKKYQAGIHFVHFLEGSYDRLRRFESEFQGREEP